MGIINAFPGGGKDALNNLIKTEGDSNFSGISPILNATSPPTTYSLIMQDGVTLITSTSDYKGVWTWDSARGLRQILTADSGIYGLSSAGDVEGGALLANGSGHSTSTTIYYYDTATETITPISTGLTAGTSIASIVPTYEGDGYWVILSYDYYNNYGNNYYGSQLKHLSWPGKVFTNKVSWDTTSRAKILAALPGGCMIQRTSDGTAYVYVYDNATGAFGSGSTGMETGNWTLRGSGNGIYYVSPNNGAYMYAYNWATKTWISGAYIGTTDYTYIMSELPGKTIFISGAIYSMDWETGTSTKICDHGSNTITHYKIDNDNYLFWTYSSSDKGIWRYTISTGDVVQLDSTLYGISAPTPWRGGLLFTKGALAYYDIAAGTLTVYDASCSASAFVNSHTVAVAAGSCLKIYDLDAAAPLVQTSAAITKSSVLALAAYGGTVLLADYYHYVYGYSISTNTPFLLDKTCATGSLMGGTAVGENGKLYVEDFTKDDRDGYGYLYDARTLQRVYITPDTLSRKIM